MRRLSFLLIVSSCFLISLASAQRTHQRRLSTSQVGATGVIASGWSAFSGGAAINHIQISGQVSTQEGSTGDAGTISGTVSADTTWSLQLSLSTTTLSESRTLSSGAFQCSWAGGDGVSHQVTPHNCLQTVSWLVPSLALETALAPSNVGIAYIGHETLGTEGVEHLQFQTIYGSAQTPTSVTSLIQQVSTADLYLDSATFLPVLLRSSIRADQDANTSIPVEVRYSNFSRISGVVVPTHIERSIDGSLQSVVNISGVATN